MAISSLHRGDVVFLVDAKGSVMHAVIATAQRAGSAFGAGKANSVHAAIATGNQDEVIESVGSGLRVSNLRPGNYRVYCYRGALFQEIREFAVEVAESHVAQQGLTQNYGQYNKVKATLCPFRPSGGHKQNNVQTQQFGEGAHAHSSFFCSNFVWRCYTAASEVAGLVQLPIPNSHSQLSPRDLEGLLFNSSNWHARNGGGSMSHP